MINTPDEAQAVINELIEQVKIMSSRACQIAVKLAAAKSKITALEGEIEKLKKEPITVEDE